MKTPIDVALLLIATGFSIFVLQPRSVQAQHIYWIGADEPAGTRGNAIFRYALEAGTVDTLVQARKLNPDFTRYFYHITVDPVRQEMYWTDSGGIDSLGTIDIGSLMRASLDGRTVDRFLRGIVCGIGSATDIEMDVASQVIYWGEASDCSGWSLNYVGADVRFPEQWQALPTQGFHDVVSIDLDTDAQVIYWSNSDWQDPPRKPLGIRRAALDQTLAPEMVVEGDICDIALHLADAKLYWTPCNDTRIRRANLDGTATADVLTSEATPSHLAIDSKGQKIYWTEREAGKIKRANLDGSNVEEVLSGLTVPTSLALPFGQEFDTATIPASSFTKPFTLHSSYPNPFRERTTIVFAVHQTMHVALDVYDALGRQIKRLAAREYAAGTHRVSWDAADQASGLYFLRMATEGGAESMPMVLQR